MKYRVIFESIEEEFSVEELEQLFYEICLTDFLSVEEINEIEEFQA